MKLFIAKIFELFKLNDLIYLVSVLIYGKEHIRVINYHGTPGHFKQNFEDQLIFYSKRYQNVTKQDLDAFFETKKWKKQQPGLIISFDDGLASNFEIAVPLLEKYNFTGWFCIPPGFIDEDVDKQEKYMEKHSITEKQAEPGTRMAMSWNEVSSLAKKHVVISHTASHHRMNEDDTERILELEIKKSREILESKIDESIDVFCWVGGEETSYTKKAHLAIQNFGYKYAFMTNNLPILKETNPFHIERTNIEVHNPLYLVKFYLSGIYDLFYLRKRKGLHKKLS